MALKRTALSISFLGETAVGKTCIVGVYLGLEFSDDHLSTIGVEKKYSLIELKTGEKIKLKLWDTAGQERFNSISYKIIRNSQGAIVVFDLTNRLSFERVINWLDNLREFSQKMPVVLFGNKCDLKDKRIITQEEIDQLCQKEKLIYFETSAKDNIGIKEGIKEIATLAYQTFGDEDEQRNEQLKKEDFKDMKKKKSFC